MNYVKLQRPVYTHDCDRCTFLGTTLDNAAIAHDWYVCGNNILARNGNNGPEYWSNILPLVEADANLMVSCSRYTQPCLNEKLIIARYMLSLKEKS